MGPGNEEPGPPTNFVIVSQREVTSYQISGDSIIVGWKSIEYSLSNNVYTYANAYSYYNNTYIKGYNPSLDRYNAAEVDVSDIYIPDSQYIEDCIKSSKCILEKDDSGRKIKAFGSTELSGDIYTQTYLHSDSDALPLIAFNNNITCNYQGDIIGADFYTGQLVYAQGLGFMYYNYSYSLFVVGGQQIGSLQAYVKNGDTTGVLYPFSYFTSSLEEQSAAQLEVYPNPAQDYLIVKDGGAVLLKEIYNLQGKKMRSSQEERIAISSLPPGMYLLKVGQAYSKFIKEK